MMLEKGYLVVINIQLTVDHTGKDQAKDIKIYTPPNVISCLLLKIKLVFCPILEITRYKLDDPPALDYHCST